jgi:hypothetical protein
MPAGARRRHCRNLDSRRDVPAPVVIAAIRMTFRASRAAIHSAAIPWSGCRPPTSLPARVAKSRAPTRRSGCEGGFPSQCLPPVISAGAPGRLRAAASVLPLAGKICKQTQAHTVASAIPRARRMSAASFRGKRASIARATRCRRIARGRAWARGITAWPALGTVPLSLASGAGARALSTRGAGFPSLPGGVRSMQATA